MYNVDDVIFGLGDFGFFCWIFGECLIVYFYGGYCGNFNYKVNVQDMLDFFVMFVVGQIQVVSVVFIQQVGN